MNDSDVADHSSLLLQLLNDPPEGIDLTLAGGSALMYWTILYHEAYPDNFENEVVATKDIDFIGLQKDAKACHEYWGGKLYVPDLDDYTPEVAILFVERPQSDPLQIDFLHDLFGISNKDALKDRVAIHKGFYILSELMVLANRIHNTLRMAKYRDERSIGQLKTAVYVAKSAIQARLDAENIRSAASLMSQILHLSKRKGVGIKLFVDFGVDLLGCIIDDPRLPEGFRASLPGYLQQIEEKRQVRINHLAKRMMEKNA